MSKEASMNSTRPSKENIFKRHKKLFTIIICVLVAIPVLYLLTYLAVIIFIPDPIGLEKIRRAQSERVLYSNMDIDAISSVEGVTFPTDVKWFDNGRLLISDFGTKSLVLFDLVNYELETLAPLPQNQIFDLEPIADNQKSQNTTTQSPTTKNEKTSNSDKTDKTEKPTEPAIFICTYKNLGRTKIEDYGTELTIQKFSLDELRALKDPKSTTKPANPATKIMIHETLMPVTCNNSHIYAETSVPEIEHRYYEIDIKSEKTASNAESKEDAYSLKVIEKIPEKYSYKVIENKTFAVYDKTGADPVFSTEQLIFLEPTKITINDEKSAMALIDNQQVYFVIKPLDLD